MVKKFRCMVCGYIHEGETAPQECPICHVGAEKFEELVETEGALAWADEHKIGVAKDVDPEILQGLRDHFNGECGEVGMYLAMSRQADREGYPEIAEAIAELEKQFAGEGRVLIRPSGTEPLVRVMIEGKDQELIEREAKKLAELIQNIML